MCSGDVAGLECGRNIAISGATRCRCLGDRGAPVIQHGTDHSIAHSKGASRPPNMKGVSMPNAFFAAGVCADLLDGEIHLD